MICPPAGCAVHAGHADGDLRLPGQDGSLASDSSARWPPRCREAASRAVAVAYNLTVTDTVGSGHLSVTPSGGSTNTSAINWTGPGQKLANASVVAASPNFAGIFGNGSLTVAAQGGATQFLVSVVGYYAPASVTPLGGCLHARRPGARLRLQDLRRSISGARPGRSTSPHPDWSRPLPRRWRTP